MAVFRPFRAVRPVEGFAAEVASLPYDVMNTREAARLVERKPLSFMAIDRAEVNFPEGTDPYSEPVYLKAKELLASLQTRGICKKDEKPMFYIYRQVMNGRVQNGLAGCVSTDDYTNNVIKKHELTRADKEVDRFKHVDYCDANTGPIFLTYRPVDEISAIIRSVTQSKQPDCDFVTEDGVGNTVWAIDDDAVIEAITAAFEKVDSLYIADGHHRAASAVNVGLRRREQNPGWDGSEEFNYFLAILFSADELEIMPYNRVTCGLDGRTADEILGQIAGKFDIKPVGKTAYAPSKRHEFGMLLGGEWYSLTAKDGTFDKDDAVKALDVSILQDNIIAPVLGITDPRTDDRIDFVGGIRGLGELEKRVSEDMEVAFSMYATSVDELMKIADSGNIMPPKSTWFEPKLLSGLFIHELSD